MLLGPDSDVGRAVLAGRRDRARHLLAAWQALLPRDGLAVEVVHHGGPEGTPGCRSHAARLLALADAAGVPAVLTAAVRHADPEQVRTVDLLDAARRLVVLDSRHLDRVTDAGHLASTAAMHATALEVTGGDRARADRLVAMTALVADECTQQARHDLGIGAVHLPEAEVLGIAPGTDPMAVLAQRCRAAVGWRYPGAGEAERQVVLDRLDEELAVIDTLGYPTYFLTVAEVTDLIRARGVRVAARGSGAGSLVNHLLGISGVDPIRHRLLMERFCSPLRAELPDIDVDVESARRTEIYEAVLDRFGAERVTCVSMMDTYKVRHAVRDVGAALGLPPVEVDEIAKAFPHIRAKDARHAIADLPELRSRGLDSPRLAAFFDLVEALDGLPRHIALHPCGIVLSNSGLLDRTPVEASWLGFPMSQFDKDDVETLGFLKLDVLGIRMQSAMAHAVAEVERVSGEHIDLDDEAQVPHDDPATYELIRTTRTLGMFQIESPGQRELVGKLGPSRFGDLVVDISLFRPGPVKSDMITPFLNSRHGWSERRFLHPSLIPALEETEGVVVFHEQVLLIVAETTGVTLAQADEVRRSMGTPQGQTDVEAWWRPAAAARGYSAEDRDRIWEVLKSFASFGFCKAHAAAFALPTFHSAWLKAHHPAAFLAGVLTHDPGMYPKRLLLDDARSFGIPVLGLDVNASGDTYRIERVDEPTRRTPRRTDAGPAGCRPTRDPDAGLPAWRRARQPYGIRLSLADVKGISAAEVARVVAGQPYADLGDFWTRARVSRPVTERLVLAGAFDSLHGMGGGGLGRRGRVTRRDLLLHVAELERWERGGGAPPRSSRRLALPRIARPRGSRPRGRRPRAGRGAVAGGPRGRAGRRAADPAHPRPRRPAAPRRRGRAARDDRSRAGARRARRARPRRLGARRRVLRPAARRARRHPQPRPARHPQPQRGVGRRGQGRHPDPAGALGPPGRLPHPRRLHRAVRLHVLRGRPGPLRRGRLPLLAAPRARGPAPHRRPRGLDPGDRRLGARGALGRLAARRPRARPRGDRRRRGRCRGPAPRRASRPPASATPAPGAGCSCTRRGSASRPTPTSARPGRPALGPGRPQDGAGAPSSPRRRPPRCPRASCGTRAPAAPGH